MRWWRWHPAHAWAWATGSLPAHPLSALASTVSEGGTISDLRAADFLFSCDASHPDTLRYLTAAWHCLSGPDAPGAGGKGGRSSRWMPGKEPVPRPRCGG